MPLGLSVRLRTRAAPSAARGIIPTLQFCTGNYHSKFLLGGARTAVPLRLLRNGSEPSTFKMQLVVSLDEPAHFQARRMLTTTHRWI